MAQSSSYDTGQENISALIPDYSILDEILVSMRTPRTDGGFAWSKIGVQLTGVVNMGLRIRLTIIWLATIESPHETLRVASLVSSQISNINYSASIL
jgi:hypothetical protein